MTKKLHPDRKFRKDKNAAIKNIKNIFLAKNKKIKTEDVSESGKVQRHSSDFSIIGPGSERETKKEILTIDFQSRFFSSLVGGFETETKNFGFGSKKKPKELETPRDLLEPQSLLFLKFYFLGKKKKI